MEALSLHAMALGLLSNAVAEGVELSLDSSGAIQGDGAEPSEGLSSALRAFCGTHEAREGSASYQALRSMARAPSVAVRELLALPIRHASGLPLPFSLHFTKGAARCVCTTSRAAYAEAKQAKVLPFVIRELSAMGLAVEMGRANERDLETWLDQKRRGGQVTHQLVRVAEMPGYRPDADTSLTFGELFDALGCVLEAVDVFEAAPAVPAQKVAVGSW